MDEKKTIHRRPDEPRILGRSEHPISRRDIDADALKILYRLNKLGFKAYLCGGAVRDLMLGRPPKDFDIVTDARPGQIKKRFAGVYIIGRRFRLAHVHFHGGKIIEVATFRKDAPPAENPAGPAIDPKAIYGTPLEDAFRRDITINALYYDAASDSVIDYLGGLEDLAHRTVRIIGDPEERFNEDPVRIWRVIRHAARLGFAIEDATERAIRRLDHLIAASPGARLFEEFNKDLAAETRPVIEALRKYGVLGHILGRIGKDYETDPALYSQLSALLDLRGGARSAGFLLTLEEVYALIFFPWLEPLFEEGQGDTIPVLNHGLESARIRMSLPRNLRSNVIQILAMVKIMIRALRTGRLRWSVLKRCHYESASRIFFLIEKHRSPEPGESFENLFRQAYSSAPQTGSKRMRRRRRRRASPDGNGDGEKNLQ